MTPRNLGARGYHLLRYVKALLYSNMMDHRDSLDDAHPHRHEDHFRDRNLFDNRNPFHDGGDLHLCAVAVPVSIPATARKGWRRREHRRQRHRQTDASDARTQARQPQRRAHDRHLDPFLRVVRTLLEEPLDAEAYFPAHTSVHSLSRTLVDITHVRMQVKGIEPGRE